MTLFTCRGEEGKADAKGVSIWAKGISFEDMLGCGNKQFIKEV